MTSLSVIMPVFNGAGWVGRSLEHLAVAIENAELDAAEVIVIDDGSTDDTAADATATMAAHPTIRFSLLDQANLGRFAARRRGLEVALHDHVLFIDTRVFIHPTALAFVAPRLDRPDEQVWTSHVVAATEGNPLAGFWQAIEHVAWRRYFKRPSTTSFGIVDFDFYPKGTTALIGPRQLFIDAFDAFAPTVADWHKVNDDTAVLRWVAERTPINISPEYSSTYNACTTLQAFLRHAEHRGTVLIDGYLRPGARFAGPILGVLAATPIGIWFVVRHPLKAIGLGVAGSVAAAVGARSLGANGHDSRVLGTYAMPFGVAYLSGMWRGVVLRVQWWLAHCGEGRPS
ncbi:MAG: glycosyltransferase [Microthrixaceae bacterium]